MYEKDHEEKLLVTLLRPQTEESTPYPGNHDGMMKQAHYFQLQKHPTLTT